MNRKAVVAGATGLIGKELVQQLLSEPAYVAVILLVRRPTGITHPKIYEKILDFANLEHADIDLSGADVFCTLGTTIKKAGTQEAFRQVDYTYPLALGRMAKTQGAKQFLIITSMGASSSSRFFYNRVKGDIELALRNLDLPALQIFRPSLLLGNRKETRVGERVAAAVSGILSPLFSGPLRKYCPIQARAVAKAMINAAQSTPARIQVYESDQIMQTSTCSWL